MKKTIVVVVVALAFMACSNNDANTSSEAEEVAQATEKSISFTVDGEASTLKWHGEKITGDQHNGTIRIANGTLDMEMDKLTAGNFVIDMKSVVQTDEMDKEWEAKLLGHLGSPDFFDAAQFPTSKFEISQVSADSLTGNLTIKGITKSITIPYTLVATETEVTATSIFSINRAEWDVRFDSGTFFSDLGDKLILDDITFDVTLIARV